MSGSYELHDLFVHRWHVLFALSPLIIAVGVCVLVTLCLPLLEYPWFVRLIRKFGIVIDMRSTSSSTENPKSTYFTNKFNQLGLTKYILECCKYTVLDRVDNYVLLQVTSDNVEFSLEGKYLQMINPSSNELIIEGVSNDCNTVEHALYFRNGTLEQPINIT